MRDRVVILHKGIHPDASERQAYDKWNPTCYVRYVRVRPGMPFQREACDIATSQHADLLEGYPRTVLIHQAESVAVYTIERSGVWYRVYDSAGVEISPNPLRKKTLEAFLADLKTEKTDGSLV